jgi:uncharacterized protein (DUF4415 family)/uncharacterized DUF497 family protein
VGRKKRQSNIAKHGIDFLLVSQMFDGRMRLDFESPRGKEQRTLSIAELDGKLIAVVWTWRGDDVVRVIQQGERGVRKKGRIVSYTAEELAAMRAGGEDKTDWAAAKAKTEAELVTDMSSDPAWNGVPEDWVKQAHVATSLMRRPKENKRQVTVRFDADVLDYFRRQGRGWQGRINAVLRSFMESHQ